MLSNISKQLKETRERWDKIDALVADLQKEVDKTKNINSKNTSYGWDIKLTELVLLLVNQLKPMSTISGSEFENGMKEILDVFVGGKNE